MRRHLLAFCKVAKYRDNAPLKSKDTIQKTVDYGACLFICLGYKSICQLVSQSISHSSTHSVSQSVKLTPFVHQQVMSSAAFQFYRTRFKQ